VAEGTAALEAGTKVTDDQRQRVESWITEALRQDPGSVPVRLNLAGLRTQQQRYDQAEEVLRTILNSHPEYVPALNNLAWLLSFQKGKENEALELVDRAADLAGPDPVLLDTRAVIRLSLGQAEAALRDLRTAIALGPQSPVFHYHLARAYRASKNEAEARKAFRRAEQLGLKQEAVDPRERDLFFKTHQELGGS
jgi:Tfp pilus assembly protein PilF